jgi:orotate phosphoribosyltransferase
MTVPRATNASLADFLDLVHGRRGHFLLESGHHGEMWLDLDGLFAEPRRIEPFVMALVERLGPHDVAAVCGPLRGGAFVAQLVAHELDVEFCFTEPAPSDTPGLYQARYHLSPTFAPRVRGKRMAVVDDVMSAGSSLRASHAELAACGAHPVVIGALLVLGDVGLAYFADQRVPVEAVLRDAFHLWSPDDCPLCAAGRPLEDVTGFVREQ